MWPPTQTDTAAHSGTHSSSWTRLIAQRHDHSLHTKAYNPTHTHSHKYTHSHTHTYILPLSTEAQSLPHSYSSYKNPATAAWKGRLAPEAAAVDPELPCTQSLCVGFRTQPEVSLWPSQRLRSSSVTMHGAPECPPSWRQHSPIKLGSRETG